MLHCNSDYVQHLMLAPRHHDAFCTAFNLPTAFFKETEEPGLCGTSSGSVQLPSSRYLDSSRQGSTLFCLE